MVRLKSKKDLDWRDRLEVGNVIRSKRGSFRIIRHINRNNDGTLYGVYLVILRCSWTHRAYTILNRSDLKAFGYSKVSTKTMKLNKKFHEKFLLCISEMWGRNEKQWTLECCDVKGLR